MKKVFILALICAFAAVLAQSSSAQQTRARRVGQAPTPRQQETRTQPQQPSDDGSQTTRPSRPPVLGGANRDPNEQKPGASQQKDSGPEDVGEGDVVRVETTLVSIPVSVMDRDGKYIPNLRKEDFRIWENGVEQQVAYFASTEKPFTVALLIDTSGSTKFKLEEIQDAAITFVDQLRADDRVMVVSFSDKIRLLSQPTNDHNMLRNAIRQTEPGNGTRLYDAVDQVINQSFNHIEGRKAIVLFTDGVDTTSKHASYESTLRDAEELDALIYPVEYDTYTDMGVWGPGGGGSSGNVIIDILGAILGGGNNGGNSGGGGGGGYPGGRGGRGRHGGGGNWPGGSGGSGTSREEYERGDQYLHDLARVSGARLYNAEQQNMDSAFRSVAEELRRQYSLGYYPKSKPNPGERRGIKVRVTRPELVVRTRDSYVFQPGANASAQSNQTQPKPPVLKKDFSGDGRNPER
ncbi:MAG TPA: VWA domain-containing protein [Pyrinomonadaceae bacterium]|nr:VWA domain-containing protein [Pyrinomonadaceae bacterium]